MKIDAEIQVRQIIGGIVDCQQVQILIPDSEISRLVESVTKAPDHIPDSGKKVDDNLAKEPEEKFLCPNCKKVWDTKKYNACECGAALKQSPPVDDNLAKARDLCLNIKENHRDITFCTAVDKIETAYESAIRERDEKIKISESEKDLVGEHLRLDAIEYGEKINELTEQMSQMMTVEELKEWYEEWNYADGYSCSFIFFVTSKIKDRNEKRDPGRETGGTD